MSRSHLVDAERFLDELTGRGVPRDPRARGRRVTQEGWARTAPVVAVGPGDPEDGNWVIVPQTLPLPAIR